MFDWFSFYLWIFMLFAGLVLLVLANNERFILWRQRVLGISGAKVQRGEKITAIGLIIWSLLSLVSMFFRALK